MTVKGPGGEQPGDTAKLPDAGGDFTVTVESPSWIAGGTLETIVNGKTVSETPLTFTGTPAKRATQTVKVTLDPAAANNWVVFHAKGTGDLAPLHPGKKPFAASNAIFLSK
jgi:hypothetical protein